jgi:5-methylcytosine-specific restriction protein B
VRIQDSQVRKVKWLLLDAEIPVEKLQEKQFSQQTIYKLNRNKLNLDYLSKLLTDTPQKSTGSENHVLIIDEINRGNISKIFGELITLLEPSKRKGADDEVILKLPYSSESFSIPENLHVVGTMNTADRSIALLDTALRRRFQFTEMLPDSGTIPGVHDGNIPDNEDDEINLRKLLDALNSRIEYLLGPDQTLGHAYFINITSFDELDNVFRNQIIPLLQEYFHEDWRLIQMVLSDAFIVSTVSDPNQLFSHVDGWDGIIPDEKQHYRIPGAFTPAMFRALYSN